MEAGFGSWEVVGAACPDCFFQEVSKESVVRSYEAAADFLKTHLEWGKDRGGWAGGGTDRDVVEEILKQDLPLLRDAPGRILVVHDDFMMCDHSAMVDTE